MKMPFTFCILLGTKLGKTESEATLCQAQFPFSLFLPLPPQHHILLNNFSTIYLKMNNKRLRLKKLHLGNLRLRKPLLLLLLLWKRRPSLLSLPSQQSRLW